MGRHVQFVMTPPRGDPLKSNSISMYFPFRDQRKRETLLPPLLITLFRRGLCHIPPSQAPTPSLPRPRETFTHESRGIVVANGLGIAKSCRDEERGSEVAEGRRGTLEKEKQEGLPIIVPISVFSG